MENQPSTTMDHYLISIRDQHQYQSHHHQQRSLVIYQHRILITRLAGRRQPLTPLQHQHARHLDRNSNHTGRRPPSSSSTSAATTTTTTGGWFFLRANTTSLMRRSRRDMQTYPPPVMIKLQYQERILQLPDEVWYRVGQFCDVTDLHNLRRCHPRLRRLLCHNAAGWKNLCHRLWQHRYHVCPAARALVASSSSPYDPDQPLHHRDEEDHVDECCYSGIRAYELSLRDAVRDRLTDDELCDHVWWFRFKTTAGADWIRDDPWHRGEPAVQMVFLRNGRVVVVNPAATLVLAGWIISWQWIDWPALLDRSSNSISNDENDDGVAMGIHRRGRGAYLRLTVSGRDVPTYIARRFPPNWGFIMENCWGVFASFELPPKKMATTTTTTTTGLLMLQLPSRNPASQQQQPTRGGPPDRGGDGGGPTRKRPRPTSTTGIGQTSALTEDDLATECYFVVNGQNQWREAFLYNIGARHIPHGPNAMEAFRHACEAALHTTATDR